MSETKTNIVLIGMPGSGKSTLGRRLASSFQLSYIDTDKLIEQAESMPVQDIIDTQGTDYFRSVEQTILCGLNVESHLLATGGSAVLSEAAMQHLATSGKLVYLRISEQTMLRRVQDGKTRGLVKMPSDSLQDLYRRRLPLYQRWADLTVDNDLSLDNLRYSELVEMISSVR